MYNTEAEKASKIKRLGILFGGVTEIEGYNRVVLCKNEEKIITLGGGEVCKKDELVTKRLHEGDFEVITVEKIDTVSSAFKRIANSVGMTGQKMLSNMGKEYVFVGNKNKIAKTAGKIIAYDPHYIISNGKIYVNIVGFVYNIENKTMTTEYIVSTEEGSEVRETSGFERLLTKPEEYLVDIGKYMILSELSEVEIIDKTSGEIVYSAKDCDRPIVMIETEESGNNNIYIVVKTKKDTGDVLMCKENITGLKRIEYSGVCTINDGVAKFGVRDRMGRTGELRFNVIETYGSLGIMKVTK